MHKQPCVYILSNKRYGTLYIGVTSQLKRRVWQHKGSIVEGFTKKFSTHLLVWYEIFDDMEAAINREKQLKKWKRIWKIRLIHSFNPLWDDLYETLDY